MSNQQNIPGGAGQAPGSEGPRFCPMCGSQQKDGARFCSKCGQDLFAIPVAPVRKKSSPWKKPLIIVGSVALLAIVCVGGFLLLKTFTPGIFGFTFVNEAAFPDERLRVAVSQQLDSDGNGIVSADDMASVTTIEVTGTAATLRKGEASKLAIALPSDEVVANSGAASAGEGSLEGLSHFPSVKVLSCCNAGLASLDLSGNQSLEYVDCRSNAFSSLNLGNNAELTTLYCDPGVSVEGLDQAGLYSTNLVTSVSMENPQGDLGASRYDVSYDETGRPIAVETTWSDGHVGYKEYTYDTMGRLIACGFDTFEYDDAGRLSTYCCGSSYAGSPFTKTYTYNDQGLLTEMYLFTGEPANYEEITTYTYEGSVLTNSHTDFPTRESQIDTTYQFDEAGNLVNMPETLYSNGLQATNDIVMSYNAQGLCTGIQESSPTISLYAVEDPSSLTTEYDEAGNPVKTIYSIFSTTLTMDYVCNPDGYVTHITWSAQSSDGIDDYRDGQTMDIAYVKRIGSLEDRITMRYVPQFQVQTEDLDGADMVHMWFQGNGTGPFVTVTEQAVEDAPLREMGIKVQALENPNEVQLETYDRIIKAAG